jgi:hypothetical protein
MSTHNAAPEADPQLDQIQAAVFLGLKNPRTMAAWRLRRCGPPYRRIGARLVRYAKSDLIAWANRHTVSA